MEVSEPFQLPPEVLGEAVDARAVDLHEVACGVADVELHEIAGQLDQLASECGAVEGAATLGRAIDRLDVIDGDPEVVVCSRVLVALEDVKLRAAEGEPR